MKIDYRLTPIGTVAYSAPGIGMKDYAALFIDGRYAGTLTREHAYLTGEWVTCAIVARDFSELSAFVEKTGYGLAFDVHNF